jgi:uncharacterized membrane protein YfcA
VFALTLIFGVAVGFSLGMTGGGGSIIAVPLLVYGLALPTRQAVGVSLAAVGATALVGAAHRLWNGEVELRTGLMFAAAGMAGAPIGAVVGRMMPEALLLLLFAILMLVVAFMMSQRASKRPAEAAVIRAPNFTAMKHDRGVSCRRDLSGRLTMTSRCALVMVAAGLVTGVLSGLFGVGGGFVVVPALVLFSSMSIHRAVATSLLVIALVSAAGVAAKLLAGESMAPATTVLFVIGGIIGLGVGTLVARRLSPVRLQKVFAVVIVAVAAFVIVKNVA